MEIKKEYVLSGCDLDQYERLVWQTQTDASMLENSGTTEANRGLRHCHFFPRTHNDAAGDNRDEAWL
jgi:hypothetical protein